MTSQAKVTRSGAHSPGGWWDEPDDFQTVADLIRRQTVVVELGTRARTAALLAGDSGHSPPRRRR